MSGNPVLQLKGILKEYPGIRAVNHASLELMPGEVHALVGENGAGKSTLIKIMAGVVRPDAGEIWLNGDQISIHSGSDAYRLGLSFIHQELNLVDYLSGAENIFLGRPYPKTLVGTVNWKKLYRQAQEILDRLGVHVPVNVPVCRLSRGDQSMISIARAFAGDAMIYVMDEPTASLTDEEIRNLFKVIEMLQSKGAAILYVSHRLEEIFEICNRVTVMRDGNVIATHPIEQINQSEMIRLMIGRKMDETVPPPEAEIGEKVFEVKGLSGHTVSDINFSLHKGEIVGLAGLVGSGRTDILRIIYGADPISTGELSLFGGNYLPKTPAKAIQNGFVLVPEERHSQGLVLGRSILENITLPSVGRLSHKGLFLNRKREQKEGKITSQAVRLKASSLQQKVGQLSGGNQQKVVFARWMIEDPKVLLLDEPSRGVDVGARYEIYKIIREMAARGVAILLVSSDLTEILGLSDRVLVMREGKMVKELPAKGLTQETILRYCYGEEK